MSLRIRPDHQRFKDIVRGKIKQDLKKYVKEGHFVGQQGRKKITVPIPQIDIPRFKFGSNEQGGVGQGDGQEGEPVPGQPQDGEGQDASPGEAGDTEGTHGLETEVTLDELADILGEELQLPRIEPKGDNIHSRKTRYNSIAMAGPESLRSFRRTFQEALKREIASGSYNPAQPIIVPRREDKRYRSFSPVSKPTANAAVIYMMDVSGSMGDAQKEIVRIESFWINTWLKKNYDGVETRFIIHDAKATVVDEQTFFHTKESGGTMISSAYKLCADMIESDFNPNSWNIYPFHFSDGDNWSSDDTKLCIDILKQRIIPISNQFSYGQVYSPYGSGQFIQDLDAAFKEADAVVTSRIKDRDAILESIKDFLGGGR